jgi:polyisoprenoid-binding protein YceI
MTNTIDTNQLNTYGKFNTIVSSSQSSADNLIRKNISIDGNLTIKPIPFDRISSGSSNEVHHNFVPKNRIQSVLQGTISFRSQGGGSDGNINHLNS